MAQLQLPGKPFLLFHILLLSEPLLSLGNKFLQSTLLSLFYCTLNHQGPLVLRGRDGNGRPVAQKHRTHSLPSAKGRMRPGTQGQAR